MTSAAFSLLLVLAVVAASTASAFTQGGLPSLAFAASPARDTTVSTTSTCLFLSSSVPPAPPGKDEDDPDDEDGADLAAELYKLAQQKGINVDSNDLLDEEEEEDDEEEDEDEQEPNIPQGAINAFLGYDTGDVGEKLSGNVSLTDDQLYSEVKERVLDTAGGFVDFVMGAKDEEDDEEEGDDEAVSEEKPKPYKPPETVPDPELTAGEVVITVLEALNHNDVPNTNRGVEILFGYSSPGSSIQQEKGLTPQEYADFLKESEYKVLFNHQEVVSVRCAKTKYNNCFGYSLLCFCI